MRVTKTFKCVLCIISLSAILTDSGATRQNRLSVKSAIGKDVLSAQSSAMNEISGKISNLEAAVNRINGKITKVQEQTQDIEELLNEDGKLMRKLDQDFDSLMSAASTHKDMLEKLEQSIYPDDNAFVFSNETCGGFLVAQAGYVTYSVRTARSESIWSYSRKPASCVWVVQANHRSSIKLTAQIFDLLHGVQGDFDSFRDIAAYVLEGISESTKFLPSNVTKLMKSVSYTFKGPLLYVVLYIPGSTNINTVRRPFNFQFQYESKGERRETDKVFTHMQTDAYLQHKLSVPGTNEDLDQNENKFTTLFTSIIFSNVTTKLTLRPTWTSSKCVNSALVIWPLSSLLSPSAEAQNLCEVSSPGENKFYSYGQPLLGFISNPLQSPFPVDFTWILDHEYPSSIMTSLVDRTQNCGSVVGGSNGYISHKRTAFYKNGERCVWVILPQPNPASSIEISFRRERSSVFNPKEMDYDPLYFMELTYLNGSYREGGPKITKISEANGTLTFMSREVYVVFYSDESITDWGFGLQWKATNNATTTEEDSPELSHFNFSGSLKGSGTATSNATEGLISKINFVLVFNPLLPYPSTETPNYFFGMDFHFNITTATRQTVANCSRKDFYMLTAANDGILRRVELNTTDCFKEVVAKNVSGLAMIIVSVPANVDGERFSFSYNWVQEVPENSRDIVKLEDGKCGGVMIGSRGVLRYKLNQKYNRNEHCIWLLSSPNSTSISLKLVKDGFGPNERLLVNTVDADNGNLENDTVHITGPAVYTFNESVIVISFRPAPIASNSTGFLLQFWSSNSSQGSQLESDEDLDEVVDFRLLHSGNTQGRFLYDWNNQTSHAPGKQLHIIGFSHNTFLNTSPVPRPINVTWNLGTFLRDKSNCTYDSVTFYVTTLFNDTDNRFWKEIVHLPHHSEDSTESEETSCPSHAIAKSKPNLFDVKYTSFLAIYKLVGDPVETVEDVDRKIDFSHSEGRPIYRSIYDIPSTEEIDTDDLSHSGSSSRFASRGSLWQRYRHHHGWARDYYRRRYSLGGGYP